MPLPLRSRPVLLLVTALAFAAPVAAQDALSNSNNLPARVSVTGVAADDVLNIRAAPDSAAPVLAELLPDATDVEVIALSDDGAWALVPFPEGQGWAATRFLTTSADDPATIPFPLRCVGTEPFWSVVLRQDGATWETPEDPARPLRPLGHAQTHDAFVLAYDDGGQTRDVTVIRRECSDGMSDRPYGFAALIWNRGEEVQSGCCLLLPR